MSQAYAIGEHIKSSAGSLTFLGIVLLVLGALAMLAPFVTGIAIATLVGVLVVAAGIAQVIFALQAGSLARGILAGLLGLLTLACGVLMIAHPILNLAFLTLLLAAYFLVSGVFEIVYAFRLRPVKGWAWMLVGGIASVLLGVVIQMQWPVSGAWAIGLLVGIRLVFAGVTLVALGSAARSFVASQPATAGA